MSHGWRALIEVLIVFIVLITGVRLFEALPYGQWIGYSCVLLFFIVFTGLAIVRKDYSSYGISLRNTDNDAKAMAVFGTSTFFLILSGLWSAGVLLLLSVTKRDFSKYGLTLRTLGSDLKIVAICIVPVIIVDYLPSVSGIFSSIGPVWYTLIFSALIVVLLFVLLLLMTRITVKEDTLKIRALYIVPAVAIGSIISIVSMTGLYVADGAPGLVLKIIDALVFGFVIQAIPQNILFRGYIQSRLNEAFGRPYVLFGINWGAGLIIAALLFGFMHVLNPFNPFRGYFNLDPLMGIWTFFFGLVYGVMREKTGNITAPTIVHGIEDSIYKFLM